MEKCKKQKLYTPDLEVVSKGKSYSRANFEVLIDLSLFSSEELTPRDNFVMSRHNS